MIETSETRTIHLAGLYETEDDNGEIEEKFFAVSMELDNNASISSAVSNCLTMRGIPPWDVTEFQTAYINRENQLDITDDEFETPEDLYQ